MITGPLWLRLLRREWKGGEILVLLVALTIAVTAISAVSFFTDRVGAAMERRAAASLAADAVLRADEPIPEQFVTRASEFGLDTASTIRMPTVVAANDRTQLIDLRAVSADYPLRGDILISDAPFAPGQATQSTPASGNAWVDARVLAALELEAGDTLQVGTSEFRIASVLASLPDQGIGFTDVAPAVLIPQADLSTTELVRPGSRISHRLLVAGERGPLNDWLAWTRSERQEGMRLTTVRDSRQEIASAIERADRFLGLAALVSVFIAAVAVALAAREWARRRLDAAAIIKTLGARQGRVLRLYLAQLFALGLAATVAGLVAGWLAQWGLVWLAGGILGESLPAADPLRPVVTGFGTALILLAGFALPPLMRLRRTPPARVLRRELAPAGADGWLVYGAAVAAICALVVGQARDSMLAVQVMLGGAATIALLLAGGYLMIRLLRRLGGGMGSGWRQGLGNLARYPARSLSLITAVGLGLMVLTLLTSVRGDLLEGWRATIPDDAPNHFLINIQPGEREGVESLLREIGAEAPDFHALVRARLTHIKGRDVDEIEAASDRGERFLDRDANLSWADELQSDNRIVAGEWWDEADHGRALMSLEVDMAEALDVSLGDTLRFRIGGNELQVTVASLREVRWDSFNPNFFMLVPPDVLDDYPATWITSVYLPPESRRELSRLVRAYPSVTIIDVQQILDQVRDIIDRASAAVEYVFAFTLLAGLTVLFAAIQASRDERRFESALLRALGGRRRHIRAMVLTEFGLAGALAGLMAGLGATVAGWLLATRVFNLDYEPGWLLVPGTMLAGLLLLTVAGWLATRGVVTRSPLVVLRSTGG